MPRDIARDGDLPANHEAPTWQRVFGALQACRVPACATIVLVALGSVFVLTSQSASSWPTYVLGVYILAGMANWRSLFLDWRFLGIVVLLAYIPLSSLWSTPADAGGGFSQAMRALLVFTFVVCIAEAIQVDWFLRRLTQAMAVVGALAAAAAIVVFFNEAPEDGRLNGLGQLDTHVVAAMAYAVAAVCGLAWLDTRDGQRAVRFAGGVCVAVLVLAVVLTGSRNGIVCMTFGMGCLVIANRVATLRGFLLIVGSFAVALLIALVATYHLVPGAGDVILPRGLSFRPAIWSEYAAQIRTEGMWFGLGVLTPDLIQVGGYDVLHPHNLYLAVTRQGGLVGLALMVAVILATAGTLLGNYADPRAKLAIAIWAIALPAYLLDGHELVDKIGWTWFLFWLPVAIALGIRPRPRTTNRQRALQQDER